MKVTVFNGSPAGCNSATNVIAGAFLKGAISAGAEAEDIFLSEYHITRRGSGRPRRCRPPQPVVLARSAPTPPFL